MFQRGDVAYILENNLNVKQAKVMNRQGNLYTIQLIGTCGAFRVSESRLFESEDAAIKSKKIYDRANTDEVGYLDSQKNQRPTLYDYDTGKKDIKR